MGILNFLTYYRNVESVNENGEVTASEGNDSLLSLKFWQANAAEFLALLLFIPLSAGSSVGLPGHASFTQIALANGFMIATLVQCVAHISGGHLNPAVTIPFAWTREISILRAVFYVLAQCAGATVGAAILTAVTPPGIRPVGCTSLGQDFTGLAQDITMGQGFLVEFVITFQLVFTIFATVDPSRRDVMGSKYLAIGISVTCGHLFAIPFTGASMNPARSFGPALVTGSCWNDHWIYWIAPILGGLVASIIYSFIFANDASKKKFLSRCCCGSDPEEAPKTNGNTASSTELGQVNAAHTAT